MAEPNNKPMSPPGQQKTHSATKTYPDGTTETKEFTQAEWRARDKTEDPPWVRDDGEEGEVV